MTLKTQKRLAADLLKVGLNRVVFDNSKLDEIKEAITKEDVRALIESKVIKLKSEKGVSRYRSRERIIQKRKGRRKGIGSKKGKRTARLPQKKDWMYNIRAQRDLLSKLKEKKLISNKDYQNLRKKSKGGFFRSKRHLKLYLEERNLLKKHGKE